VAQFWFPLSSAGRWYLQTLLMNESLEINMATQILVPVIILLILLASLLRWWPSFLENWKARLLSGLLWVSLGLILGLLMFLAGASTKAVLQSFVVPATGGVITAFGAIRLRRNQHKG
jgi:peptidoglycan/LPS O-acetylase OafA/YrhL